MKMRRRRIRYAIILGPNKKNPDWKPLLLFLNPKWHRKA
jgi:hypothetical protein